MKLAAITRYETSSRPWNRLIEIAADRFPDTLEDLTALRLRKVKLELRINEDATAYEAVLVGPDVATVEQRRTEEGMLALDEPLAALAIDTQQFEVTRARRLAREAARGELTPAVCALDLRGVRIPGFRCRALPVPGRDPDEHCRKETARTAMVVPRQDAVAMRDAGRPPAVQ